MSTSTQHYQLTKPDGIDKYSIAVFNANADAIDLAMYNNAQAILTKQDKITGAASSVVSSNLTADRVIITNSSGKIAISSISTTKLGYLSDVTSNIQAQFTAMGTRVTTAQSTADGKVSKGGDEMTGNLTIKRNVPTLIQASTNASVVLSNMPNSYINIAEQKFSDSKDEAIVNTRVDADATYTRYFIAVKSYVNGVATDKRFDFYNYKDGTAALILPQSPAYNDSSTKVATTGWVNNINNDVVHKSRAETITGIKTFSADPIVLKNAPYVILKDTKYALTDDITDNYNYGCIPFKDKNGIDIGRFTVRGYTDGRHRMYYEIFGRDGTSVAGMGVWLDANGNAHADAPTTPSNAISNQIATANWCLSKFQSKVTISTSAPSGGNDGDLWAVYE